MFYFGTRIPAEKLSEQERTARRIYPLFCNGKFSKDEILP